MPKVALTADQRRQIEALDTCNDVIRRLNIKRAELDMGKDDFGKHIGLNPTTWHRYRTCSLQGVTFRRLLDMLQRVGLTLVCMTPAEEKKWRATKWA